MEYGSIRETAQRWGVSANRVSLLARQGRIPGAVKIDCRWIIPLSAEKPADARADRYSKAGDSSRDQVDAFHFPLLLYMGADTDVAPAGLSDDELALHHAQAALEQGNIREAYEELSCLTKRVMSVHVRAGALYSLTACCMLMHATGEAKDAAQSLHELLAEDVPHRQDLIPLLNEVDALTKGRGAYMSNEVSAPGYSFHPTTLTYLACYSLSAELLRFAAAAGRYPLNLSGYDVSCARLEAEGFLYAASKMHINPALQCVGLKLPSLVRASV